MLGGALTERSEVGAVGDVDDGLGGSTVPTGGAGEHSQTRFAT